MSAAKPINIQDIQKRECENLSQFAYRKPYDSLDSVRQGRVLIRVREWMKDHGYVDPEPGKCFDCGRPLSFNKIGQCWYCHEGTMPTQRGLWLEHDEDSRREWVE